MGFYNNVGASRENRAEALAQKIFQKYQEDSNIYRLKRPEFRRIKTKKITTELKMSSMQKQGTGVRFIVSIENIKKVLMQDLYINYKDELANRWHIYHINFTSVKK